MNGNGYLFDSNIVIGLFANEAVITKKIASFSGRIFIPSIVLGELFYGAYQSTRKEENTKKIEALATTAFVLECDADTARFYGEIKSFLKANGTPIPENDIWIAAIAKQHQLVLVTRDKHFNNINVISIENW